jgi:hypothetical protein
LSKIKSEKVSKRYVMGHCPSWGCSGWEGVISGGKRERPIWRKEEME